MQTIGQRSYLDPKRAPTRWPLIAPGIDLIGELIGLDAAMTGSDLVIVGEGSLDDQALEGKAPIAVARAAMRRDIPVLALSGIIQAETRSHLHINGIWAAECIRDLTEDRDDAIRNARPLLRVLAASAMMHLLPTPARRAEAR